MSFRRKRVFRKRKTKSVAQQALTMAKSLKKLINVEFKHVDAEGESLNIIPSGTFKFLNPLIKGLNNTNRVGNTVRFKSLDINMQFNVNTEGAELQDVRWTILKYHKPNNAGLPSLTDVYDGPDSLQMLNIDNVSNWSIVRTGTMVLNAQLLVKQVHLKIPLNDVTYYSGNAGTDTDIEKNLFFALFSTKVTTFQPTLHVVSRMRYIDN